MPFYNYCARESIIICGRTPSPTSGAESRCPKQGTPCPLFRRPGQAALLDAITRSASRATAARINLLRRAQSSWCRHGELRLPPDFFTLNGDKKRLKSPYYNVCVLCEADLRPRFTLEKLREFPLKVETI